MRRASTAHSRFVRCLSSVRIHSPALLLFSISACAESSTDLGPPTAGDLYLEEALDILEANSLHRYDIDWFGLRAKVTADAGQIETTTDAYPAIRNALALIGDEHSSLLAPSDTAGSQASVNQRPTIRLMDDESSAPPVGYIRVPEAIGKDVDVLAAAYHRGIERVDTAGACGWIIDLRSNFGGSMWPMIAGLGPIIGEGLLGFYVDPDSVRDPWSYEAGASVRDGVPIVQLEDPYVLHEPNPPTAVLVDIFTASSAEGTMISFIGRPQTRTIGSQTAGFSTSNRAFTLSDGAVLLVTTSVMADRTGRTYGGRIWPDVLAGGDRSLSLVTDQSYRVAVEWLRDQSTCSG